MIDNVVDASAKLMTISHWFPYGEGSKAPNIFVNLNDFNYKINKRVSLKRFMKNLNSKILWHCVFNSIYLSKLNKDKGYF